MKTLNRRARGFSLVEAMITMAMIGVVTLISASVVTNVGTGMRYVQAQGSNVQLANDLRLLVSRRGSCAASMVGPPAGFDGTRPVAIRLNTGGTVVQSGAVLPDVGLTIKALELRNIAPAGTTNGGNPVYLADLSMTTRSRDAAITGFRDVTIARLALEASGAGLAACYAADTNADTTQQMQSMCGRITSPDGVPSTEVNGRCVTGDVNISATCAAMGGAWTGTSCTIKRTSFIVSRTVPAGAYNDGTGYGVSCPANSVMTGGACTSSIPPRIPMGGMYLGGGYANYFGCAWQLGYEDTSYNIYAACLR